MISHKVSIWSLIFNFASIHYKYQWKKSVIIRANVRDWLWSVMSLFYSGYTNLVSPTTRRKLAIDWKQNCQILRILYGIMMLLFSNIISLDKQAINIDVAYTQITVFNREETKTNMKINSKSNITLEKWFIIMLAIQMIIRCVQAIQFSLGCKLMFLFQIDVCPRCVVYKYF